MRRFLLLFGLLAIGWWGIGAFRARGDVPWTQVGTGLQGRTFMWRGAQIHAFRAAPRRIEIASGDYLNAQEWLRRTRAHVAINGGYFDGKGQAMGLRVSASKRLARLRRADWGVFWIKNGIAHIAHTRDFPTSSRPEEAIQCGPRLVVNGKTTDLKPQWDRRTGLGIDERGRVVLAIADGQLSLDEWAKVFASNDGLGCRDALNLDGGGSTQIAYSNDAKRGEIQGSWPVPDAIVIR